MAEVKAKKQDEEEMEDEDDDLNEVEVEEGSLESRTDSSFSERGVWQPIRSSPTLESDNSAQVEQPVSRREERVEEPVGRIYDTASGRYETGGARQTGGIVADRQDGALDGRKFRGAGESWGKTSEDDERERYQPFETPKSEDEMKSVIEKRRRML